MRSSELSNSRESPGLSCNSSRTGLGSTSRPVLSSVRVVTTNAILPYHLPFRMLSELRSSIPSGSHADADGRYLTAQRLCSTITSTSHLHFAEGFSCRTRTFSYPKCIPYQKSVPGNGSCCWSQLPMLRDRFF